MPESCSAVRASNGFVTSVELVYVDASAANAAVHTPLNNTAAVALTLLPSP